VREWLEANGFGRQIDAFEAEGITLDIAASLTDADLIALGLTRIGDRRRFQAALVSIANQGAAAPARGFADAQTTFPTRFRGIMERRPLTLMFVDIVGSTAMLDHWGDEATQQILLRYRELVADACQRFGGQIYRYLGDGVLAYFCYPRANENDPERAVRAALEIVQGIGRVTMPDGVPIQVRIGIATGRVIIGDMFSPGSADWSSVIGNAANLAAKLQGLAQPNGIVISDETRAKVTGRFELRDRGMHAIPGFAGDLPVWQVVGVRSGAERRLGVAEGPLRGRAAELERLEALWRRAEAGRGAATMICGEPGIGKSRLLRHVLDLRAIEGVRILRLAGSGLDSDTPLEPFLGYFRSAAGLDLPEAGERARADLAAVLRGTAQQRETALRLLCELLRIEPPSGPVPPGSAWQPGLPPAKLRALSIAAIVGQVQETATDRPMVLVVEDLHWFDPTSREALVAILQDRAARRMLVLITSRDGAGIEQIVAHCDAILPLGPLGRDDLVELVRGIAGGTELRPRMLQAILDKAEGVPLFVEECTRALVQKGGSAGPGDGAEPAIPDSIDELLAERLDRAGEAKTVAQAAAVFGPSVRYNLLAVATALSPPELEGRLAELQRAGVLRHDPAAEGEVWQFTHALLRDAAYDGLLGERRRELHGRAVHAIERVEPEMPERQPAIFAHHLTEAGRGEDASRYWIEAGRRALARSAFEEASRVLERGLKALDRQVPSPPILEARLETMALLGPTLMALHGSGSAEAKRLYTEAFDICEALPEARTHFPIYWGWWRQSGDFAMTEQRSRQLLARAQARGDPELLLQAHHCSWASAYHQGDLCGCLDHIEKGLSLYAANDCRDHAQLYGNHDPKVCAHGNRAQAFWLQGRPVSAHAEERLADNWSDELQHLGSRVHAIDVGLLLAFYRRDVHRVMHLARRLTDLAFEHTMPDYQSKAMIFSGWADAQLAEPERGLAMIETGFARQRDIGTNEDFLIYYTLLAEALGRTGRPDRALEELSRARSELSQSGMLFWMPEIYRMLGDMMLLVEPGSGARAAAEYAYAQMLATQQGAAMLALRAALAAARIELREGLVDEAAARLSAARSLVLESDGGTDLHAADTLAARIRSRLTRPQSLA